MQVKKGVILCGGLGTRFLPITKAMPKEMLPVVDTPVLGYIVKEMIDSGVDRICIVVSPGKEDIINYFLPNDRLEAALKQGNKQSELDCLHSIGEGAAFEFVTQFEPKGMAHALLQAREFVGGDPFVLSTGDDLVYASTPISKQMMTAFNGNCDAIIGGQRVADDKVSLYGIVEPGEFIDGSERMLVCKSIVEKPQKENAPSNFAALGRYILSAKIFDKIMQIKPDKKGELQVTDALKLICSEGKAFFYNFDGTRYDMGNKAGAVIASVAYALRNDEMKDEVLLAIKEMVK